MPTSTRIPDQFDANLLDSHALIANYNTHAAARQYREGLVNFIRNFGFDAMAAVNDAYETAYEALASVPTVLGDGAYLSSAIPVYGSPVSVIPGQFGGIPIGTLSYQWKRGASAISGATASTYTPVSADLTNILSCVVTCTNDSGSVTSTATASAATADDANAPHNTAVPSFTGTATVGQLLTGSAGTWTPGTGLTFAYQWYRDTTAISGATALNYTLVADDATHTVTLKVTATNAKAQSVTASSTASATVAAS